MDVKVRSKGDGLYSCSYTPNSPLKHTVAVAWGGVSVPNSPFRVSSQSQHPVSKGSDFPSKAEDPVKTESAKVVQSETLVKAESIRSVQSEGNFNVVQSKHKGASSKTKKPLIIITTYTEKRFSY